MGFQAVLNLVCTGIIILAVIYIIKSTRNINKATKKVSTAINEGKLERAQLLERVEWLETRKEGSR